MSLTVTALPDANPPKFTIGIGAANGAVITDIVLLRYSRGVQEPTRVQPTPGPSPRTIDDVEAPWHSDVVYTATVTTANGVEKYAGSVARLEPTRAWIIHPTVPALSRPMDSGSFASMGVVSIGAVSREAATTGHTVLGSKYRVITKTGPRQASQTELVLATVTHDEQEALWALVEDQTPLLLRVPAPWGWDWEDGYYDVGKVDASRFVQYGPERRRTFTWPLERVEAPAGTQQAPRTYADVLAGFASYSTLAGAYATYTDLLTDTRR